MRPYTSSIQSRNSSMFKEEKRATGFVGFLKYIYYRLFRLYNNITLYGKKFAWISYSGIFILFKF